MRRTQTPRGPPRRGATRSEERFPGQVRHLRRPVLLLLGEPVRRRVDGGGLDRANISGVSNAAEPSSDPPRWPPAAPPRARGGVPPARGTRYAPTTTEPMCGPAPMDDLLRPGRRALSMFPEVRHVRGGCLANRLTHRSGSRRAGGTRRRCLDPTTRRAPSPSARSAFCGPARAKEHKVTFRPGPSSAKLNGASP